MNTQEQVTSQAQQIQLAGETIYLLSEFVSKVSMAHHAGEPIQLTLDDSIVETCLAANMLLSDYLSFLAEVLETKMDISTE